LLSVCHLVVVDILLSAQELLVVLGLLFLLDQVAESAAARGSNVGDAGTLEVVLVTDIHALHGFWDPVETEAHRGKEEQALFGMLASKPEVYLGASMATYRSVDWLISLHVTILTCSVVGLAEGDAWAAVGDQACII
jgi:hypothetical protein